MQRHRFAAGLALAVVSLLVLAGPAAAGRQVPFKGTLEGVVTAVTPVAPPIVSVEIEGSGRATHLGRFTVSIPHLTDRSDSTLVGSYEFTAANGDTLTADFTGQAMPTDVPGVLYVVETATITGGTGRFAGATGSFTGERYVDTAAGTITGSFTGTISSHGSRRHGDHDRDERDHNDSDRDDERSDRDGDDDGDRDDERSDRDGDDD